VLKLGIWFHIRMELKSLPGKRHRHTSSARDPVANPNSRHHSFLLLLSVLRESVLIWIQCRIIAIHELSKSLRSRLLLLASVLLYLDLDVFSAASLFGKASWALLV